MDEKSAKAQAERIALAIEEDHRQAEHYLLSYARERKDYAKRRAEYVYKTTAGHDPTAQSAERGIFFDTHARAAHWLRAVEILEQSLPEEKQLFLRLRRDAEKQKGNGFSRGRHGWAIRVQHRLAEEMETRYPGRSFWMGERTLKAWWKDIICRTAEIAARLRKK
ncbi:hypothetical protein [Mitsuokella jalaludinii]|uniref:hypothetical protein n=1 Tax=Mitsuokella jalaludinii TaxID=187979 RepID=UPI0030772999